VGDRHLAAGTGRDGQDRQRGQDAGQVHGAACPPDRRGARTGRRRTCAG
jgi:hypothetical protein